MDKTAIHRSYMEQCKSLFGNLPTAQCHGVLMSGTIRKGSIGEKIKYALKEDSHLVTEFRADIRDQEEVRSFFSQPNDTLILCHGVTHLDWFEDAPAAKLAEIMDVNVTGTMWAIQEFVRASMGVKFQKNIIIIGSMAYRAVLNGSAAYCASKAALAHLVKCLAWELAPKGFNVYAIHPSNTLGAPMSEDTIQGLMRYRNLSREDAEAYWGAVLPKAQWLKPGDIAEVVRFLLSGKADYLSGAQLDLAGGQR